MDYIPSEMIVVKIKELIIFIINDYYIIILIKFELIILSNHIWYFTKWDKKVLPHSGNNTT